MHSKSWLVNFKRYIMKKIFNNSGLILPLLITLGLFSCKVNTLETVEALEQKVSLVQIDGDRAELKPDNIVVDKEKLLIKKTFGIALSGLKENKGFTADVRLSFDDVPEGYEKMKPDECFLSGEFGGAESNGNITVPARSSQLPFYLNISKSAIDANAGKKLAVKIAVDNVSNYAMNTAKKSAYVLINTADFGTLKTDVTDQYFKNSTFARKAGTTARFADLADWIANDAISKSRPTGAGFDANAGFLGIERWGSYDSPIIDGKIYQTFSLPAGNYVIEVDMKKVAADRDTYFVVAEGNELPDASGIAGAFAKKEITNASNNVPLVMEFKLAETKKVSIGFLINIDQGVQKIIQASKIKMYKVEGLFD